MSSHSGASRRPAFDIVLAIGTTVVTFGLSRLFRNQLPAPDGKAWLWGLAIVAVIVAYRFALKRGMTAFRWTACFGGTYLLLQLVVQLVVAAGIARS